MKTGTKEVKESVLYNKVVYIAMPLRLYEDKLVTRALKHLKTHKPLAIIDPRGMFSSNAEWEKNFPRYLKPCEACVVITDDGMVGKGVYRELQYFSEKNKPSLLYVEHPTSQSLHDITQVNIVNWNNWTNYAEVLYESNDRLYGR